MSAWFPDGVVGGRNGELLSSPRCDSQDSLREALKANCVRTGPFGSPQRACWQSGFFFGGGINFCFSCSYFNAAAFILSWLLFGVALQLFFHFGSFFEYL